MSVLIVSGCCSSSKNGIFAIVLRLFQIYVQTKMYERSCRVDTKLDPPTNAAAALGSVEMVKWKVRWEHHNNKSKEWALQISPLILT